jgi:cell division protein FtsQ
MIVEALRRGLDALPGLPTLRRRAPRSRTRRRLSARTRVLIAAVVVGVVALLGGGWLWLQDSSLVAVRRVQVTGLGGTDGQQIRTALVTAARGMTTLDVRLGALRAAVSPYPIVKDLHVSTQFPHGMRIEVVEQVPVAVVTLGSRPVPVAADGTILHDMTVSGSLPQLSVRATPGGSRITEGWALMQLQALAAAPRAFLAKISDVSSNYWHGIVVQLRQGPSLYLGNGRQLVAKWRAVAAVLAARQSTGAGYIDVSDPQRPAAGAGGAATAAAITSGATSAAGSTTSTPSIGG